MFWTYTKIEYALRILRGIKNLFITPSNTPCGINYGHCDYLLKIHKTLIAAGYRVHICACGTDYQKHCDECNCGCKQVGVTVDFVLFIEHSTDYKAGKNDPKEFKAVCEIIAKQNN